MFQLVTTLLAIVSAIAVALIAPVDYIEALRDYPLWMLLVAFLKFGAVIYISYVVFNIISGLAGQGDAGRNPVLYWMDYIPSWIAWFSLNLTALWVALGLLGIVKGYSPITALADVPNSYWVLLALVLFSWLDVGVLQGHKHEAARQYIAAQRAITPAAPVPPPAPLPGTPVAAPTGIGTGLLIAAAIIVVFILAMIFSGGGTNLGGLNDASGKSGLTDNRGVCEKITTGVNADGTPKFVLAC